MEWIYAGMVLTVFGLAVGLVGERSRRREDRTMRELLDSLKNALAELEQFNQKGESSKVEEKAKQIRELQTLLSQNAD